MQHNYKDFYGEFGCCLTCTEQEYNEIEDGKCLCRDCKCRHCYWYEEDEYDEYAGRPVGHCEYPRETEEYTTEYDKNVFISQRIKETKKAVYCSISGLSNFTLAYFWVPKTQIDGDKISSWWLEEKGLEGIIDPHNAQCERCGEIRNLTKIKINSLFSMVCDECMTNLKEEES